VTGARRERLPQRYEIRIHGWLGPTIRLAFPALLARTDGADTLLTGELADQVALYRVFSQAQALGLELMEVRRLPAEEPGER
jgi:hypothetical protein